MDSIENTNEENIEAESEVLAIIESNTLPYKTLKPISRDSFRINIVCKCGVCEQCVFTGFDNTDSEKSEMENSIESEIGPVDTENVERDIYDNKEVYEISSVFEGENPTVSQENITMEIEEPVFNISDKIPKIIFIVPYRDRQTQLTEFSKHMKILLEDMNPEDYIIYYAHQCDKRSFNRGAMKNIGFIAMKNKYKNEYKNITFVFNDVDTMPSIKGLINYETTPGVVKHFYGYLHTLGGIVSIKGADFERVNGFPQYWAWGFEDNLFNRRIIEAKIPIDRRQFYKIEDDRIIHFKDGPIRDINSGEFQRYLQQNKEGISNIKNLIYDIDTNNLINIRSFTTGYDENMSLRKDYDIRNGPIPFNVGHPIRKGPRMHMIM